MTIKAKKTTGYYIPGQEGAALIVLVVSLLCMALLGAAMYTMTTTSTMSGVQLNLAQRAYYLAESGLRWMEAEYINDPVSAETIYRNITAGNNISMGAANGNGQIALQIHTFYGRYDASASVGNNFVLTVPGTLDPAVFNLDPDESLDVNNEVLWHNGGLLTFTAIKRLVNTNGTDNLSITIDNTTASLPRDNDRVAFTAQVAEGAVIVNDGDLSLKSGGQFFPLSHGVIRTKANITAPNAGPGYIKFYYKKRTGNKLEGISHYETEGGVPITQATLISGEPLVLLPCFHFVSTGTMGTTASSSVDGYLFDGKSVEDSGIEEYKDHGDDLGKWTSNHPGDKGSFEIRSVDGDNAFKVKSLDVYGDNNIHEASMTLDWSKTPVDLKKSAIFAGGFLNYEIQTKIKQDTGDTDNSYLAGISFRVQKNGSQYGVSLFRPREIEASTPDTINLTGTVRDFKQSHPDMEFDIFHGCNGQEDGLVKDTLGPPEPGSNPERRLPVYNNSPSCMLHGEAEFNQWYRDVDGVNMSTNHTITLEKKAGTDTYYYDSTSFFPIDGRLFGNEGNSHNYHFTYELHSKFTYKEGQTFTFRGDDDIFVFINNKLAIDLGGVHVAAQKSVNLDTLGLTEGEVYNFDFFFAERHTTESNFRIETTIHLINYTDGTPGSTDKTGGTSVWPHIPPMNGPSPQISGDTIQMDGWGPLTETWLKKKCNKKGPDFFGDDNRPKTAQLVDSDCTDDCFPICKNTKPTYYDVWNTNFDWDSLDINDTGQSTNANNTFLIIWQRTPSGGSYKFNWLSYRLLNPATDLPEIDDDGIIKDSTTGAIRDWSTLGVRVKEISRVWVTITNSTAYDNINRGEFISVAENGSAKDGNAGGFCFDKPLKELNGKGRFLLTRVNRDSENDKIYPFSNNSFVYAKGVKVGIIMNHHDQVNFIQAYVSRTDQNGTPGPDKMIAIDKNRKGNSRGEINWFPEDHEILDANNDYHRMIQWMGWNNEDEHASGDYTESEVMAGETWTRSNYNMENIFSRLATILTPSIANHDFTPENNPEIGIHSYGAVGDPEVSSGIDMYFDDFAIRAEIPIPELGATIGTAQSR